jgi:thioredoxin 2
MNESNPASHASGDVATLRCGFCNALNRVDVSRAAQRPVCGECGRPFLLDRPVKVAQEDFERSVLQSGVPVLVDFYADWCAPCRMLAPILDRLAAAGQGRVLVAKVDTDASPEVAGRYGIRSIPTVILFRDGVEAERSVGIEPERLATMVGSAEPLS